MFNSPWKEVGVSGLAVDCFFRGPALPRVVGEFRCGYKQLSEKNLLGIYTQLPYQKSEAAFMEKIFHCGYHSEHLNFKQQRKWQPSEHEKMRVIVV